MKAQTCGAGEGDRIAPGTMGWTTLSLTPGRYELFCNIAGHSRLRHVHRARRHTSDVKAVIHRLPPFIAVVSASNASGFDHAQQDGRVFEGVESVP